MKLVGMLVLKCGFLMAVAGACGFGAAARISPADELALRAVHGGFSFYCATVEPDDAAVDCTECQSNGNGGSILCTVGPPAQTHSDYIVGQNPRMRVDCANDTKCNPLQQSQTAKMYTYCGDCSSCSFYMTTCLREVQTCGAGPDPGTCPPP